MQEAVEVDAGVDAAVRRSLHRVHGDAVHGGVRSALADSDALRDAH